MGRKFHLVSFALSLLVASACERSTERRVAVPPPQTEQVEAETRSQSTEPVSGEKAADAPNQSAPPLPAPRPAEVERPRKIDVPEGYLGPIDPQWPPRHAAALEVELRAGRLIRQAVEHGESPVLKHVLEGDIPDVFAHEGRIGNFDYIEVVLGPMKHPDEPMPLVILLHGRGGRPTIPAGPYSTERPLRLFIPRGPDKLGEGFTWLATWTNAGQDELLGRSLAGRVDELMPAIEAFTKLRKTVNKPIVVGFSQGAIMTFGLVTRFPQRFSAAFPIAGWLPRAMIPKKPADPAQYPFIHALHGGADTTVPTSKGRTTVERLRKLGLKVEYSEFDGVGHVVTDEMGYLVRKWVMESVRANSG